MKIKEFAGYFNPWSNDHHAMREFKKLPTSKQIAIIATSAIGSVFPVAGNCAIFRKTTEMLSKDSKNYNSLGETDQVALEALANVDRNEDLDAHYRSAEKALQERYLNWDSIDPRVRACIEEIVVISPKRYLNRYDFPQSLRDKVEMAYSELPEGQEEMKKRNLIEEFSKSYVPLSEEELETKRRDAIKKEKSEALENTLKLNKLVYLERFPELLEDMTIDQLSEIILADPSEVRFIRKLPAEKIKDVVDRCIVLNNENEKGLKDQIPMNEIEEMSADELAEMIAENPSSLFQLNSISPKKLKVVVELSLNLTNKINSEISDLLYDARSNNTLEHLENRPDIIKKMDLNLLETIISENPSQIKFVIQHDPERLDKVIRGVSLLISAKIREGKINFKDLPVELKNDIDIAETAVEHDPSNFELLSVETKNKLFKDEVYMRDLCKGINRVKLGGNYREKREEGIRINYRYLPKELKDELIRQYPRFIEQGYFKLIKGTYYAFSDDVEKTLTPKQLEEFKANDLI